MYWAPMRPILSIRARSGGAITAPQSALAAARHERGHQPVEGHAANGEGDGAVVGASEPAARAGRLALARGLGEFCRAPAHGTGRVAHRHARIVERRSAIVDWRGPDWYRWRR